MGKVRSLQFAVCRVHALQCAMFVSSLARNVQSSLRPRAERPSKQQAASKHVQKGGKKPEFCGDSDCAEISVDDIYKCNHTKFNE